MARDMQVDLLVNPIVDTKKFDASMKTLQRMANKGVSGLSSKDSAAFESLATKLMTSLMVSGRAKTSTQARLQIQDLLGTLSGTTKSALRGAQNMSDFVIKSGRVMPYESFSEKQIKGWRGDLSSTAKLYNDMLNSYAAFKESPSEQTKDSLLKAVMLVNDQLSNMTKERRKGLLAVAKIAQNTASIKKEASDFSIDSETPNKPEGSKTVNRILSSIKKISGLTSLAAIVSKGAHALSNALRRGEQAMRLQAAYGKDINWRDIRARAGVFNMTTEEAAAPSQYASDFQQRMMWGEMSEREIIGLSRAGRWGRMVMSGEAARNPEAANQAFEELVATTDAAKMRSILRQIGLPQGLMQYNIQGYDQTTKSEYFARFGEVADKEWQAAVMMYDAGNQLQLFSEQVSQVLAYATGKGVQYMSPQGRAFAHNMGVDVVSQEAVLRARANVQDTLWGALGVNPKHFSAVVGNTQAMANGGNTTNVNQTNYYTINGTSEETIDLFGSKVDEAMSKALYNQQVNAIPGATTSVG